MSTSPKRLAAWRALRWRSPGSPSWPRPPPRPTRPARTSSSARSMAAEATAGAGLQRRLRRAVQPDRRLDRPRSARTSRTVPRPVHRRRRDGPARLAAAGGHYLVRMSSVGTAPALPVARPRRVAVHQHGGSRWPGAAPRQRRPADVRGDLAGSRRCRSTWSASTDCGGCHQLRGPRAGPAATVDARARNALRPTAPTPTTTPLTSPLRRRLLRPARASRPPPAASPAPSPRSRAPTPTPRRTWTRPSPPRGS